MTKAFVRDVKLIKLNIEADIPIIIQRYLNEKYLLVM